MSEVARELLSSREKVVEGLCSAGFTLQDECTLVGNLDVDGSAVEHIITVPRDFPIVMPKVSTTGGEGGISWHREATGHFCLWSADGTGDLPWLEASSIIERVLEWHRLDKADWPGDAPVLDLERYWPQLSDLVLYPDLGPLDRRECKVVRHERENPLLWRLEPGRPSAKNKPSRRSALVLSVGELKYPLRTLFEINELLDDQEAELLERRLTSGDLRVLVLAYTRQGRAGALVLFVEKLEPFELSAAQSAHDGEETRRMRAGVDAEILSGKRVAVVGMGSVGSHVAEELARSRVGGLTLVDGELLRPGNCIRHVLSHEGVGINKAEGMRTYLHRKELIDQSNVTAMDKRLTSAAEVEALFNEHDLVIDATGNGPASTLIITASQIMNKIAISVCIQRGGTTLRIDRFPLKEGEAHAPIVVDGGPTAVAWEGGCGDPVSPTPPWVCSAAGAHVAGMAADLLTGRGQYPATVILYVTAEPDTDVHVTSAT
jgi:hypothetical protein